MKFEVHELPKAKADKRHIFDDMLRKLETHATIFGEALENADCQLDIKQTFFKTGRGRVYRILFFIDRNDVYVLRIRGSGQAPVNPSDI